MVFAEAQILMLICFRHSDLDDLDEKNKELKFLFKEIRKRVQKIKLHSLGCFFTLLDSKTEKMILRYVEICKENLEF